MRGIRGVSRPRAQRRSGGGVRRVRVVAVSMLLGVAGGLCFVAPALAAAPEVPELSVQAPVAATTVTFHGVLSPHATGPVEAGTYSFLYNEGVSCEGGSETTPVAFSGEAGPEEVTEAVGGLTAHSKYAVCLRVEDTGGHAMSAPVAFETALPPETPVTVEAKPVAGTTATLVGELNPHSTAKDGYEFTYGTGGSCEGTTTTPGVQATGTKLKVSTAVAGLEGGTEYTFCVVEVNEAGETAAGAPLKFRTLAAAPVIPAASETVSAITPVGGTLEARINPENQATAYHLEYANNPGLTSPTVVGEGSFPGVSEEQAAAAAIGGLTPSTTYYYRAVATDGTGTTKGTIEHFTTAAAMGPAVEEESSSSISQTTASLSALVNPGFQPLTVCEFLLSGGGLGPMQCAPSAAELGEGGAGVGTGVSLTGLEANTEYHYKTLIENATGPSEGPEQAFLTFPDPPAVATGGASAGPTSATVSATVNPDAEGHPGQDETSYYFQYGHTTSYGGQSPFPTGNAGEGLTPAPVAADLAGLEPGSSYHYRIVATNDNVNTEGGLPQTVYGNDATFTTPATLPTLTTATVSNITQSTATINSTLDPQNLPTRYELQLGATPGGLQPETSGNTATPVQLALTATSLSPATLYYYTLTATNTNGTTETTGTFTTTPAPPAPGPLAQPPTPQLLSTPTIAFPPETPNTKPPPPKPTNKQKLTKALKTCHKQKNKHKRATCEKQAHKKYPTTHNGK